MSGNKKRIGFAEQYVLGLTAGIIGATTKAPIDRVKLLVQCQGEMIKTGRLTEPYKGVIDCAIRTYRSESLSLLWRGNLASCIGAILSPTLNFALKDTVKSLSFLKPSKNDSYTVLFTKNVFSGVAAGALSLSFLYSLDYTRTRLANDIKAGEKFKGGERQFNGLIDVYAKTLKSDGFIGLYRGFMISCVGIMVYRGCYFGFYDTLKPLLLGENAGYATSFILGFGVTIMAGLVSYPLDTVRRRMMMRSGEVVKYKGSWDCAVQIIRNEGALSLMKGATASIVSGITGAVVLVVYDKLKT